MIDRCCCDDGAAAIAKRRCAGATTRKLLSLSAPPRHGAFAITALAGARRLLYTLKIDCPLARKNSRQAVKETARPIACAEVS